ncbi:FAD-dependent monooxygenase [Nocardia sp. CDC160]|uniref:FAD-dependent monooxygenase n=1 Tax=Nocardia sp. CDC160 TaxID=3112166 RepID=UPI002DBA6C18|nr:FAD-dependent monooxygenase [Nocardia sp. CDC160]MEC3916390.1 FAD-dependent monooxygenase [Nocardia sp. CDC160]
MPKNIATTDVVIAGAGPNGLMLACELALAGIRPIVLDRLPAPSLEPKANGLAGQVARVLDMRDLYGAFSGNSGAPVPAPQYIFGGMSLDLTAVQPNPVHLVLKPQPEMVEILTKRAIDLGVDLRWGHALTDIARDEDRVTVSVASSDGTYTLRPRFLVAADGGKSLVRKRIGIDFPGVTATGHVARTGHVTVPAKLRIGDGRITIPGVGTFGLGHHRLERGIFVYAELQPDRPLIGTIEFQGGEQFSDAVPMTLDELQSSADRVLGTHLPLSAPTWPGPHNLRRTIGQNTRIAEHYRSGNIFLLGDAAHVHSAMGGPGLNLGLQDTVNLGWKLAAELHGWAPANLLDTYESERHPVAERVMMYTLSQAALVSPGPETTALRTLFTELLHLPEVSTHIANLLAGSDIRYDVGDPHPLSGHLFPDLDIETTTGPTRIAELLRPAHPLLLTFAPTTTLSTIAAPWRDRVTSIPATCPKPPAAALLIRPDGYVAWATDDPTDAAHTALRTALERWFGTPNPAESEGAVE